MAWHPYANVFMCQFALVQMHAACERAPDNAEYRLALGVAQYRRGKFQKERYPEALATLTKCDQTQPATLALLAMTQHQLGQQDQARESFDKAVQLMEKATQNDEDSKRFRAEVAALLGLVKQ